MERNAVNSNGVPANWEVKDETFSVLTILGRQAEKLKSFRFVRLVIHLNI